MFLPFCFQSRFSFPTIFFRDGFDWPWKYTRSLLEEDRLDKDPLSLDQYVKISIVHLKNLHSRKILGYVFFLELQIPVTKHSRYNRPLDFLLNQKLCDAIFRIFWQKLHTTYKIQTLVMLHKKQHIEVHIIRGAVVSNKS